MSILHVNCDCSEKLVMPIALLSEKKYIYILNLRVKQYVGQTEKHSQEKCEHVYRIGSMQS